LLRWPQPGTRRSPWWRHTWSQRPPLPEHPALVPTHEHANTQALTLRTANFLDAPASATKSFPVRRRRRRKEEGGCGVRCSVAVPFSSEPLYILGARRST
jgi:hypothetical protein